MGGQCATCTILGRHFERVSVPAHVPDKYNILMADREFAVVSGHTRRLFPRVCCHFWPQRRHHTGFLFLSCKLPRNRSRQNCREPKRQTSVSSLLLEYDLKSRENQVANLKLSLFFSLQGAINRRRRRSVKGHSVLCKTSCTSSLMRAIYESKSSLRVVDSSYLCRQRFLPNNYLAKWGQPLQMLQSHTQWRLKHFFLAICRGINIRQIWPAKDQHHQVNYSGNQKAWWQTLEPWQGHLWDRENLIGSSSLDRIETKSAGVALLFSTEIASTYISAWSHRCTLWTFQEEEARILAATNSTIAVECNELERGSVYSSRIDMCISWQVRHLANVVASTVGRSSDQNSFVHDTEEKRWLHDRTKEEHRKRLGVHRKTFRHRSPGHDLLWTGSNPQDSSFLVTARYRPPTVWKSVWRTRRPLRTTALSDHQVIDTNLPPDPLEPRLYKALHR